MDISTSRGLSGGHPETEGINAAGEVIETVLHAHEVELDLTRYELGISRTFDDQWDAFVRIPYLVKDQTAAVVFPNGGTAEERAAAIRSGYTHHRTDLYEGFADIEAGVGWRKQGTFLGDDSIFRFSLGFALPNGRTESDPLAAGDLGQFHTHIQFGNGTLDPLLDFYLGVPFTKKVALSLFGRSRLPFYENIHGYRGSVEASLVPRVTWLPSKNLSFSTGLAANYYGYSEWHGRRDPNSGQFTINAILGAGYKWNEHLTTSLTVLLPVYTDTFSSEDALDPAPTFALSAGWNF